MGAGQSARKLPQQIALCKAKNDKRLANFQAAQSRHLQVQKGKIGFFTLDSINALTTVAALLHDEQIRFLL
jgi:hypothetical protein